MKILRRCPVSGIGKSNFEGTLTELLAGREVRSGLDIGFFRSSLIGSAFGYSEV